MDVLPRITRQLFELIEKMTVPQRILFSIVTLFVLAGLGWIVVQNRNDEFRPLASGKSFSSQDLTAAEQALATAKLTAFRREGQQLLAPANELDKYNAVLAQVNESAPDLGTQMLRQYETMGPFSTERQRQQMKEALLLQELRLMIKNVPEIEDARVAVASSDRRAGWNQKPRSTANITLKPKAGKEISAGLVSSLRHVVANMVPDLSPADVTIFDVTKGAVYSTAITPVVAADFEETQKNLIRNYEQQLRKSLAHIRNANITVHVEMPSATEVDHGQPTDAWSDPNDESTADSTRQPDEYETAFRGSEVGREQSSRSRPSNLQAVKVGVTFPRDYVHQIAKRRASKGETSRERLSPDLIEDEIIAQVERIVTRTIPGISPDNSISVTCVDPVSQEADRESQTPQMAQLEKLLQQWKWPLSGLAIVLLAALSLTVGRGTTKSIVTADDDAEEIVSVAQETEHEPDPIPASVVAASDRVVQLREEVRSMVSSDSTASAAILAQWLTENAA